MKMIAVRQCAAVLFLIATHTASFPQGVGPRFEVAVIKPSVGDERSQGFMTDGRQVAIRYEDLTSLLMYAYGIHQRQIVGGPSWMSEHFDIVGLSDQPDEPNRAQLREMLRGLLKERFGLQAHRAIRRIPVYVLTAAKGGNKLKAASNNDHISTQRGSRGAMGQTMSFSNNTLSEFSSGMQYFLDRPIIDRTGLSGRYDINLQWNPDISSGQTGQMFADLFTAVREQLGLQLSSEKSDAEVLVIDRIRRPSEN